MILPFIEYFPLNYNIMLSFFCNFIHVVMCTLVGVSELGIFILPPSGVFLIEQGLPYIIYTAKVLCNRLFSRCMIILNAACEKLCI